MVLATDGFCKGWFWQRMVLISGLEYFRLLPVKNLEAIIYLFNYQLPITNYQLPITNYQLPVTNYQLPIYSYFCQTTKITPQTIKLKPTRRIKGIDSLKMK